MRLTNYRVNWPAIVLLLYAAVMITANFVILGWTVLEARQDAVPPSEFLEPTGKADKAAYCPGETMHLDLHFKVNRDGVNIVYESWYNVDKQFTAVREADPDYIIVKTSNQGHGLGFAVVPDLPPGRYEYRRAIRGIGSPTTSVIGVPFIIPQECKK